MDNDKLNEINKKAIQQAINELQNKMNTLNARLIEMEKRNALQMNELKQLKSQIAILTAMRGTGPTSV